MSPFFRISHAMCQSDMGESTKREEETSHLCLVSVWSPRSCVCSPQQEFLPFSSGSAFPGRRPSKENWRKSWYRQFYGRLTQMLRSEDAGAGNGFISLLWEFGKKGMGDSMWRTMSF